MVNITSFYERSEALLAAQFRDRLDNGERTNFQKLLYGLIVPVQEINTIEQQLLTERWLSTAIGIQLDLLGDILGLTRLSGESDDDYRERLYFQVFVNSSKGTPEEMIRMIQFFTQGTEITYQEIYPAYFDIQTNGTNFPDNPSDLVDALHQAAPIATQYPTIGATFGVPLPFGFAGDSELENLWVAPNVDDSTEIHELELDDGVGNPLLLVNRQIAGPTENVGYFAESDYPIDSGMGQLVEVLMHNGAISPLP